MKHKKSLMLKGYDAEDELERDIPHIYAEVIKSSKYTSLSDSPKISK